MDFTALPWHRITSFHLATSASLTYSRAPRWESEVDVKLDVNMNPTSTQA